MSYNFIAQYDFNHGGFGTQIALPGQTRGAALVGQS